VSWSVLVFYLASRSHRNLNWNWIQINLQIIKRFENKKKEFLITNWSWAETQLGAEPGHASRFLPFPLSMFHVAQPSEPRPNTLTAAGRSSHRVLIRYTKPLARIRPNKRTSDLLGLQPDPNPSSYPLSRSFKTAFIPFLISPYSLWFEADFEID
jgi:hypothetical protein